MVVVLEEMPGEVADSIGGAVASGDTDGLENMLDSVDQDIAHGLATSGATSVHVELEALAGFYNQLADFHDQLTGIIHKTSSAAQAMKGVQAGGHVPGAGTAWKAFHEAAGSGPSANDTLVANMAKVDATIVKHMASLHDTAQSYAAHEGYAVQNFGKAAKVPTVATAHPGPTSTGHASDGGYVGR